MFFLRVCNATRYNTVLFNMSDAEDSNVRSRPNPEVVDPSIGAAIQAAVTRSIGSLTDNLTQVIESRLTDFAKRFSEENSSSVEQAVKKARREQYTCKRKDNQQQLDHSLQVLDKLDEASDALKHKSYEKVKAALESGTELVSKRVKAIKLADKSEFGWATVNEYLSDELASDSDDEKRIYRAERRTERKVTKEKRRRAHSGDKGSGSASTSRATSSRYASSDLVSRPEARPARRLGPCFKISTKHFFALLSLFLSSSIMALPHRP
ncbi:uncharacterized protein [Porites lutea]|uniref:uncharacterized protein n=1 Tax=Porites lutea TaxID=51062 RepID=UPI003CC5E78D